MTEATSLSEVANPDTLCPTSGDVCAARALIVSLYSEHVDPDLAKGLPGAVDPKLNGIKMGIKLTELTAGAVAMNCRGMEQEVCPVRQSMDDSAVRTTAVKGIRKILRKHNKEEQ